MKSVKIIVVMASVAAMLLVTTAAQATLTAYLRTDSGGTSVIITPSMLNSDITLNVWADVVGSGTTYTSDKLVYLYYAVKSSNSGGGAIQGATGVGVTARSVPDTQFSQSGYQLGVMADLTLPVADSITDLGSNATSPGTSYAKPFASPTTPPVGGGTNGGESVTNGWRWKVEQLTFHIGNVILGSGSTTMSVVLPTTMGGAIKGANWYEEGKGTTLQTPANNTYTAAATPGVTFTLEATQVTANAGGTYSVHYGTNGSQANPLHGSGAVTAGFGTVSEKKWDLDGDGIFETTQSNGSIDVTYNQLKALGYQYNTAKAATFQYNTNDGKTATDVATVTIMPDTVVVAGAGGPYTVDFGADGNQVYQLNGSGSVTSGDGVILSKMWDLNGDGTFETTQTGDSLAVTYNMLKALGYVDNVAKEATFRAATDTNVLATGSGAITLLPEPATMALLGLGGLALAIRRRRAA